jgi:hypothetical protein
MCHTVYMSETVAVRVRDMSDDELLALWTTDPDGPTGRSSMAEAKRRDAAAYAKAHREAIRAEWAEGAFALYLQAEAETRGNMLSRKGEAADIDPWSLFSGVERRVKCYGSEELNNFFLDHPRVTLEEYTRQRAASLQAQQDEYEAEQDAGQSESGADEPAQDADETVRDNCPQECDTETETEHDDAQPVDDQGDRNHDAAPRCRPHRAGSRPGSAGPRPVRPGDRPARRHDRGRRLLRHPGRHDPARTVQRPGRQPPALARA